MRKHYLILLLFIWMLSACNAQQTKIIFEPLYADDPEGLNGIYNPERGLRLEVAVQITEKTDVWNPDKYPGITTHLESEQKIYESDSISLVQTYFYLTGAVGKSLTEEDFQTMQVFFDKLRESGIKAVLRFAYETAFMGRAEVGPTIEDIQRHTSQLKPFLEKNKDVIAVMQAGIIGAWGEWHSSYHGLEKSDETKRQILEYICDMTPPERMVQIRVPEYKNLLKDKPAYYNRLSFHDDFIVIDPHLWDGEMSEGTPAFQQIVEESPYLFIDGELPWGNWSMNEDPDNPEAGWIVDGVKTARQLYKQHYTSLSAIHNYKERNTTDKYSMIYWKETPLSTEYLKKEKMPFSPAYFTKRDGTPVERNVFDYIRDHLGYRLELQSFTSPENLKQGENATVSLTLINRGFSTLFNEHPVYFVLINEKGEICHKVLTDAKVHDWQPYSPTDPACIPLIHKVTARITMPENAGKGVYTIGLWIPDGSEQLMYNQRYAIRCANRDVKWNVTKDNRYGINLLKEITYK